MRVVYGEKEGECRRGMEGPLPMLEGALGLES